MKCKKCGTNLPEEAVYCFACGAKQCSDARKGVKRRGNGQGTVYKRGNVWEARVTRFVGGSRITLKKSGFQRKKDALDYLPVLSASKQKVKSIPTLRALYDPWCQSAMAKLSSSKQTAYRIAWDKLSDIADVEIPELTIADLQDAIDRKAPTFYPARDMKSLLSHLYKRACAQGDIPSNLAQFIELPKLEERERQPFTRDEMQRIWDAFSRNDIFAGYVLLMIYTGMMPGELLKCEKSMIDWERMEIVGCGIKTKERKTKPIVIANILLPVLETLCNSTDDDKLVNMSRNDFYDAFDAAMKRFGCRDLTPYSCRHTTGTELALSEANIPPSVIQRVMRHAKFTTTQRYIHPDSSDAHAAVNSIMPE